MIKIKNISKSFGDNKVLDNVSIHISNGEFIAIVGESGTGKSTLLNMIGSLEKTDKGYIEIDDRKISSSNRKLRTNLFRHTLSYLFQNFALVENLSVYDNMKIATKFVKKSKSEKEEMINKALLNVGLDGKTNQIVHTLSGGEQQRLAIARIIVKPSKIVLADEPTGNLDDENAKLIFEMLKNINREFNKTIIVVTHNLDYLSYFDRVINLNELKI